MYGLPEPLFKRLPEIEEKYLADRMNWPEEYCPLCDPQVIRESIYFETGQMLLIYNKYPYSHVSNDNGTTWHPLTHHMMIIPQVHTNQIQGRAWEESLFLFHYWERKVRGEGDVIAVCRDAGDKERTVPYHCHTHVMVKPYELEDYGGRR